jgi:serine/threonine protein kinase
MADLIAVTFDSKYTYVRQIISTLYGEIALVSMNEKKEMACIKISRTDAIDKKRGVTCCDDPQKEIDILTTMKDHPHIVSIIDSKITKHGVFLVIKYLPFGDFYTYMNDPSSPKLTEPELRVIFLQIISAIQAMHAKNLVCTDLSIENIGIEAKGSAEKPEDWKVRLIDLGAVCPINFHNVAAFRDRFYRKPIPGKDGMGAPEAYDYQTGFTVSPWSPKQFQVWTLGIILYTLIVKHSPFSKRYDVWYNLITSGQWMDPRYIEIMKTHKAYTWGHLSPSLVDLIDKMIKGSTKRITFEQVISHQWVTGKLVQSSKIHVTAPVPNQNDKLPLPKT